MQFQTNFSLKDLNTFGIAAQAAQYVAVDSVANLRYAINKNDGRFPIAILGGGSNILLTRDLPHLVIQNEIKGIQIERETEDYTIVKAGAGENWHKFVVWCIEHRLGGVENLSLIPGTVGAAPMQNIGAYGVELKDVFEHLEAVELSTGAVHTFFKQDCAFGYRESVFKHELKDFYCITNVYFKLTNRNHQLHTTYGDITRTLEEQHVTTPTIEAISHAVIKIRSSKLPDPKVIGNAGSFFKNPEIDHEYFQQLLSQFPHIVHFDLPNGRVKIPAGWLIEQCGWKGKRVGNTGAYEKQALVLVNYGNATGQEIWNLALEIVASVKAKFGVTIQPEVNIW